MRRYGGYDFHAAGSIGEEERYRGLPLPAVTVTISFTEPFRVAGKPKTGLDTMRSSGFVGGLRLEHVLLGQGYDPRGLFMELNPLAVRSLFGVPAGELVGSFVDLADLPCRWGRRLVEQVAVQHTWEQRWAVLDNTLATALRPVRIPPELRWAWFRMQSGGGRASVQTLAGEVGWSRQTLRKRFLAEFGLGPKSMSRLIRFEHSVEHLVRGGPHIRSGTGPAVGFYDQPHLINEWRALAGCTPSAWLHDELRVAGDGLVRIVAGKRASR